MRPEAAEFIPAQWVPSPSQWLVKSTDYSKSAQSGEKNPVRSNRRVSGTKSGLSVDPLLYGKPKGAEKTVQASKNQPLKDDPPETWALNYRKWSISSAGSKESARSSASTRAPPSSSSVTGSHGADSVPSTPGQAGPEVPQHGMFHN